jgi:hypothetical protein
MTAEQLAERLHARHSGAGWIARCPAHQDRSPSLSIREGDDGRVLLHCFGGCPPETILGTIDLTIRDLFSRNTLPPDPPQLRAAKHVAANALAALRSRLTKRERVLPVTIIETDRGNLDAAIARGLALAVNEELVQLILVEPANED